MFPTGSEPKTGLLKRDVHEQDAGQNNKCVVLEMVNCIIMVILCFLNNNYKKCHGSTMTRFFVP